MRGWSRTEICARLLLCAAGLCAAVLFTCAGSSAVLAFASESGETAAAAGKQGMLDGLCIAVDAGHGGYDGGAVGRVSGVPEKGLNLDVAQRVRELLLAHGAEVVMTRTDDYALCDENPPIRKKLQDMQRRRSV